MTPAAEIRAAANRLDDVAGKATKNVCPDWTRSVVRHINRNVDIECWHPGVKDVDDLDDGYDHSGWSRYDDAPWISLVDPRIAATLLALLRVAGEAAADHPGLANPSASTFDGDWHTAQLIRGGLDLARVINGAEVPDA